MTTDISHIMPLWAFAALNFIALVIIARILKL